MTRVAPLRMFVASLMASMAFWTVAAICLVLPVAQTPYVHADGSPDNAPVRAVGVLIMLSPLLLAVLTAAIFISAFVLQRFKRLSPRSIATMVVTASLGVATLLVIDRHFGWRDQLYYLAGFFSFLLTAFTTSAAVWWKVARAASSISPACDPQIDSLPQQTR
ncbi:hypothetical protein [Acidovorax sp. Root267]|uniref:hypothetical protein n=1 Tax=Acidovorax sp. Root267 TaxID=1736505 RepID=UPI000B215895|nr:hypothetical protein [Acidovorax sp. Root267]